MPASAHASATTAAALNPMSKLLPLLLPVLFLVMQHGTGSGGAASWRVSPQNMKLALRVVACCVASIAALAATLPLVGYGNTHPVYYGSASSSTSSRFTSGEWSVYRWQGSMVSVVDSHVRDGYLELETGPMGTPQLLPYESGSSGPSSGRATPPCQPDANTTRTASGSSAASSVRAWSPAPGTPSTSGDTPTSGTLPLLPDPAVALPPKCVYRHDPYSFRGIRRMDVKNDTRVVTFHVGPQDAPTKTAVSVATGALLKSQQYPLDLRRRGRRPDAEKVSHEGGNKAKVPMPPAPAGEVPPSEPVTTAAVVRRSRNPASTQARKAFKRAVEGSGATLTDALYEVELHEQLFSHETRNAPAVQYPVLQADVENGPPAINDGMTTMTGLPNADGHRVAVLVLQRMQKVGIVRGAWSLATPPRRVDRFNTGACHVNFAEVDDALRVQQALRQFPLFASFRDGVLTVGHASH